MKSLTYIRKLKEKVWDLRRPTKRVDEMKWTGKSINDTKREEWNRGTSGEKRTDTHWDFDWHKHPGYVPRSLDNKRIRSEASLKVHRDSEEIERKKKRGLSERVKEVLIKEPESKWELDIPLSCTSHLGADGVSLGRVGTTIPGSDSRMRPDTRDHVSTIITVVKTFNP